MAKVISETKTDAMQWWLDTLQNLVKALGNGLVLSLEEKLFEACIVFKEMNNNDDKRVQQADECAFQMLAVMKKDSFDPREPPSEFVEQKRLLLALLNGGLIPKVLLAMHMAARQNW